MGLLHKSRVDMQNYQKEDLASMIANLSGPEQHELLEILQKHINSTDDRIYWRENAIIRNLISNKYVEILDGKEMLWYNWKIVHITLPKVGEFKWFKFDYFISDEEVDFKTFNENPQVKDLSHSREDIVNLLEAINDYMREHGVIIDKNENKSLHYESLNQRRGSCNVYSDAGRILQEVTGLGHSWTGKSCWLKDRMHDGQVDLWYHDGFYFSAGSERYGHKKRLLLTPSN